MSGITVAGTLKSPPKIHVTHQAPPDGWLLSESMTAAQREIISSKVAVLGTKSNDA